MPAVIDDSMHSWNRICSLMCTSGLAPEMSARGADNSSPLVGLGLLFRSKDRSGHALFFRPPYKSWTRLN
jgi:hypothetical protein